MRKILLTGDRPSGKLHLGHYVGSLRNRVQMQRNFDSFIMIADVQALTDNFQNPERVKEHVYEVAADYLSVGIDPQIATVYIQSLIPEIMELTMYYMNLVTLSRLKRNPTVKAELQQKGMEQSIPAGFLCYPVNQAADITAFKAQVVPVGDDQLPMIEQTNEIVRRFNSLYGVTLLQECEAVLSESGRLPGIDGKGKASKSLGNAIFLTDLPETVHAKIRAMFTDPGHIKASDPGQVEGNIVFAYLDAFHSDKDELAELKAHYQRGGLGDVAIKSILEKDIESLLSPMRAKRADLKQSDIREILYEGSRKARAIATQTLEEVRAVVGVHTWPKV